MKIKHLIFTTLVGASLALGFSSCSNDDEDIFENTTESLVTNLSFEDTNPKSGEIEGNLTWKKPTDMSELSTVVIYASEDGSTKGDKLGEVSPDKETFEVKSMNYVKYFIVTSKNKNGIEGLKFTKIEIEDIVGATVVTNLAFSDIQYLLGKIEGEVTWTKPVGYMNLSKVALYASSDGIKKDTKLGEVSAETESFAIEARDYFKYLIIVGVNDNNSEEENFAKIEIEDIAGGIYILNSGKSNSNNANLAYYDFKTETLTERIFEGANNKALGDTGQDIVIYGSKMYIAVYESAVIYVTDKSGKILKTIESTKDAVKQKPRSLAALDGKVYATFFDGYLAKIDTTSLNIEGQVKVGRNPEYVRTANGKIFVANSGGLDYNTPLGYDKTVSVVDAASFTESEKVDVVINPDKMAVDSEGDIYVISNGNYGDVPNTLQRIRKEGDKYVVTKVGNATWMSMSNDKLYIIYSQYDANWNQTISYHVYDAKTEKIITNNFITDGTDIKKPYSITTDPIYNYVYIGTSDYTNNGDMYIFTSEGKLVKKFDTKGINPMGAYFVTK
ncbi:MAG: YncE family protein [Dysgonomonas sp.]